MAESRHGRDDVRRIRRFLLNAEALPMHHVAGAGFYVAVSLAGVGGVFEAARWAGPIEIARHAVLALALGWTGAIPMALAAAGFAFSALSIAWIVPFRQHLTETELARSCEVGADASFADRRRTQAQPLLTV